MAAAYGISKDEIAAALKTFKSVKRRLEVKAQVNGITVIDDFAHHPTAIAGTLKALRARYAGARLWAILEPRSNTLRRRVLQSDLARSLASLMKLLSRAYFVPRQYRKMNGWSCPNSRPRSKNMASVLGCSGMLMNRPGRLPRDRTGDIVAILSNGGFGGIYEKLPARLRALAGDAAAVDSARAAGKLMKHFHSRHAPTQQIIQIILLLLVIVARCSAITNYTISLANPEQHFVEVQIILPEGSSATGVAASSLECALPGPQLCAIRKLGPRQGPCRTATTLTRIER